MWVGKIDFQKRCIPRVFISSTITELEVAVYFLNCLATLSCKSFLINRSQFPYCEPGELDHLLVILISCYSENLLVVTSWDYIYTQWRLVFFCWGGGCVWQTTTLPPSRGTSNPCSGDRAVAGTTGSGGDWESVGTSGTARHIGQRRASGSVGRIEQRRAHRAAEGIRHWWGTSCSGGDQGICKQGRSPFCQENTV